MNKKVYYTFLGSSLFFASLFFASCNKTKEHTIVFKNYDGTILQEVTLKDGEQVEYTGETPTKEATTQYYYEFIGWNQELTKVTADAVYIAQFSENLQSYTVTWVNVDESVLEVDEAVPYGSMPTFDGSQPSYEDVQYVYEFVGWDKEITSVTGNIQYKATYQTTLQSYTVTWKNEDGTILETDENVLYGTMPTYDGVTPVKDADKYHTYTFKDWNKSVEFVSGNVEYIATYASTLIETPMDISIDFYGKDWFSSDGAILKLKATDYDGGTKEYDLNKVQFSEYTATIPEESVKIQVIRYGNDGTTIWNTSNEYLFDGKVSKLMISTLPENGDLVPFVAVDYLYLDFTNISDYESAWNVSWANVGVLFNDGTSTKVSFDGAYGRVAIPETATTFSIMRTSASNADFVKTVDRWCVSPVFNLNATNKTLCLSYSQISLGVVEGTWKDASSNQKISVSFNNENLTRWSDWALFVLETKYENGVVDTIILNGDINSYTTSAMVSVDTIALRVLRYALNELPTYWEQTNFIDVNLNEATSFGFATDGSFGVYVPSAEEQIYLTVDFTGLDASVLTGGERFGFYFYNDSGFNVWVQATLNEGIAQILVPSSATKLQILRTSIKDEVISWESDNWGTVSEMEINFDSLSLRLTGMLVAEWVIE